ncbi:unnamed protein product [Vicia faba]|uniref:Uncharacterized protein n=1 Tax=Vicia faba TaxID=3906 RepID=A0AAV1AQR0_VICFA|nr:unnamed protein product [Vicia faba]
MRHVHFWVTNRFVPIKILIRVSHIILVEENRELQDMLVTPMPHLTPFENKIFPISKTPLGVDPFEMPGRQTIWIAWYLLMHFEQHLETVDVVHLHNIKLYDCSLCSLNYCILGVWFMVQT